MVAFKKSRLSLKIENDISLQYKMYCTLLVLVFSWHIYGIQSDIQDDRFSFVFCEYNTSYYIYIWKKRCWILYRLLLKCFKGFVNIYRSYRTSSIKFVNFHTKECWNLKRSFFLYLFFMCFATLTEKIVTFRLLYYFVLDYCVSLYHFND